MKKILLFFTISLLALSFGGCSKDDETMLTKTVVYEASFQESDENSELYLKGEYIDASGQKVKIDAPLPFKIEMKNVPVNIKTGFSGYIFSIKASYLVGFMKMTVTQNSNNKTVYSNRSDVDLYTNASLGFTSEELKKETSFNFREN